MQDIERVVSMGVNIGSDRLQHTMYWYSFDDTERERADRQAEAQAEYSKCINQLNKEVGNLGEVVFWRWCQTYLPSTTWEWQNHDSWAHGEPETNSSDFRIAATDVDVKTTAQTDGTTARHWIDTVMENSGSTIYVFVLLTANQEQGAIIGWGRKSDLVDHERTAGGSESPFDYFPVRDMHDIIPQLNLI